MYHQDCFDTSITNVSCNTQHSIAENRKVENDHINHIVLGSTIPSVLLIFVLIIVTICLKKKGIICAKEERNENTIVHQNDLYGNLSNQDYFDERYDTNVVDMNETYQQYREYEE